MEKLYTVSKNKTGSGLPVNWDSSELGLPVNWDSTPLQLPVDSHELLIAKFRLKLKKVGRNH